MAATAGNDCAWVRIISIDPGDVLTWATARQILGHNRAVQRVCGDD